MQFILMLDELHRLIDQMENMEIKHIYRERNVPANDLAKVGILMQEGTWYISEYKNIVLKESLQNF